MAATPLSLQLKINVDRPLASHLPLSIMIHLRKHWCTFLYNQSKTDQGFILEKQHVLHMGASHTFTDLQVNKKKGPGFKNVSVTDLKQTSQTCQIENRRKDVWVLTDQTSSLYLTLCAADTDHRERASVTVLSVKEMGVREVVTCGRTFSHLITTRSLLCYNIKTCSPVVVGLIVQHYSTDLSTWEVRAIHSIWPYCAKQCGLRVRHQKQEWSGEILFWRVRK